MDTITATKASERAEQLRKQLAGLHRRKGEVEVALQREHGTQEDATAKRAKLVGELAGADEATAAWAHHEIDGLDSTLRLSSRVAEGLSNSLSGLVREIAGLEPELHEAELQVGRERSAKSLTDFRNRLEQAAHQVAQDLDNARRAFGALHLCAVKGIDEHVVEEYRNAALRICEQVFSDFESKQVNLEARGLKRVAAGFQNTSNTGVFIRPMIEG